MPEGGTAGSPKEAADDGGIGLAVYLEPLDDTRIGHLIQFLGRQMPINKTKTAEDLVEPLAEGLLVRLGRIPGRTDFPQLRAKRGIRGTVEQDVAVIGSNHDLAAAQLHDEVLPDLTQARND